MIDIAWDRVMDMARADQGGGRDEGTNKVEDSKGQDRMEGSKGQGRMEGSKGQGRMEGIVESKTEWTAWPGA